MQFSLLSLLGIQPQQLAAVGAAVPQEGKQGTESEGTAFSELLVSANPQQSDSQQGQQQASGGDLVRELVANIMVAQEDGHVVSGVTNPHAAHIQNILDRKISPETAHELLQQFSGNSNGEKPPEALKEALEQIEASGEVSTVQDILSQVAAGQPDEITEQRATTLQRALQWLQQALTSNPAPMEALAAMSAGATFPEITTPASERRKETQGTEEVAKMIPHWVRQISVPTDETSQSTSAPARVVSNVAEKILSPMASNAPFATLPEVDLPDTRTAEAAPVEQGITADDALVLVATKQNTPHQHAHGQNKPDVFEAMIADLSMEPSSDVAIEDLAVSPSSKEGEPTSINGLAHQPSATSAEHRVHDNVRIHHANFAYLRSEVMDQVKVGVTQAISDGVDRITIQLNPQDLGRVEVKMDIAADGMSQISFLVDKADTFDLLQRDARALERMLQEAGVRADAGSMEFNLRQESQNKEPWGEAADHNDGNAAATEVSNLSTTFNPGDLPTQMYVHLVSDRLDITA
ncbi:MAG: flagellar hook-length control protein FliK [Alphaproteobacteria bacterium]|nr:flagellar hook-length control protein FliK [Alphaproteobacteria bacterium]